MSALDAKGWPRGLTTAMAESVEAFPLRFVIVDNSGSMQASDGKRLVTSNGALKSISATRWAELGDVCKDMADIASTLAAPTHFHLLNPSPYGQYFSAGDDGSTMIGKRSDTNDDVQAFYRALSTSPTGTTPLTEAVNSITQLITPHREKLIAHGQQVVVVLATDGVPNNRSTFLQALQTLQRLPVWLVVRLCTDEDSVVEYWAELDKQLEAPLETLDDLVSEAKEVCDLNPWLCYAPSLQIARTMGLRDKIFDLIDEQKLLPAQAKMLIERVLGCENLPEPELELQAFLKEVERVQSTMTTVYNPLKGKMSHWIDVSKLSRSCGMGNGNGPACAIM